MRNKILLLAAALAVAVLAAAQPAGLTKEAKSLLTLTTYNADGSVRNASNSVFVGPSGEAVAMWHPFVGASRAIVTDADGKQHNVGAMLGASGIYDLCVFRVMTDASTAIQSVATQPSTSSAGTSELYLLQRGQKKPVVKKVRVVRREKFMENMDYFVLDDRDIASDDLGCPLFNANGQLVGIAQRPATGGQAYSADIRLTATFKIDGLTINDPTLARTGIRTALPDSVEQAAVTLLLAASKDSATYQAYIDEFVQRFPSATEGYSAMADQSLRKGQIAAADGILQKEVAHAAKKDEALNDYAKKVYAATISRIDTTYTAWNLDYALKLAQDAYTANPIPAYQHLQAQIIYSKGDYNTALEMFTALTKTELGKNGEVWYEAAQCKQRLGAPHAEVMALLDSAVNVQQGAVAAPYVLARGLAYDEEGETRKAFADYLKYDTLMYFNASADFYYVKYKCERKIKQYQLAINDIAHAIALQPREPLYYAELASLQLSLGKVDDALTTCDLAMRLTDTMPDLFIIKGIGLCAKGNNTEGLEALRHAQQLGDERAAALIEKYSHK